MVCTPLCISSMVLLISTLPFGGVLAQANPEMGGSLPGCIGSVKGEVVLIIPAFTACSSHFWIIARLVSSIRYASQTSPRSNSLGLLLILGLLLRVAPALPSEVAFPPSDLPA